jgi:metallophosphoesterase (TIGR00282 family)
VRILFIGDIVGRPGLQIVRSAVPRLRAEHGLDVVIANAENVSGGSGCLPAAYRQLREAGVDLVTLGDHVFKKAEIISVMGDDERICRPANYPARAPGRTFAHLTLPGGVTVATFCVLGRTFMRPVNCPFEAADVVLNELAGRASVVIVDAHAEATADKYLLAHHLKGRVTAVVGTHTHVPTADEQVLPGGTGFLCDVGMTGPHDSILGRRVDRVLHHALSFTPTPFDVAEGDVRLNGAIITCDPESGRASSVERLVVRV